MEITEPICKHKIQRILIIQSNKAKHYSDSDVPRDKRERDSTTPCVQTNITEMASRSIYKKISGFIFIEPAKLTSLSGNVISRFARRFMV